MSEQVKVNVDTHVEAYPELGISEAQEGSGDAYEIPADMLSDLRDAYGAVEQAERAIMEHIAAKYPDAEDVAIWLREREEDDE